MSKQKNPLCLTTQGIHKIYLYFNIDLCPLLRLSLQETSSLRTLLFSIN